MTSYCEELKWEGSGKYDIHGHIPIQKHNCVGKMVFIIVFVEL